MTDSVNYSVFNIPAEDDKAACVLFEAVAQGVIARGGRVGVAFSHSHGPAYVTLELPEGVTPADVGADVAEVVAASSATAPSPATEAGDRLVGYVQHEVSNEKETPSDEDC